MGLEEVLVAHFFFADGAEGRVGVHGLWWLCCLGELGALVVFESSCLGEKLGGCGWTDLVQFVAYE